MNKRRKILFALGAGTFVAPFGAIAQQKGKVWRIGFLWDAEQSLFVNRLDAFVAGMRELGYVEGRDYVIEHRQAHADLARLRTMAAELVALKVDLIHPQGTRAAIAAHDATRDIPILIANMSDPVGSGIAASLRRPGGNVTGLTSLQSELKTKHLDLLHQIVPGIRRVGYLYDPDNASSALGWTQFESNCRTLKIQAIRATLRNAKEVEGVFNKLQSNKAQGIVVSNGSVNFTLRERIIENAAKHRLPAIYAQSNFAEAGGLLSYGASDTDQYRRAAAYADKIFKGTKPGDLPIEQPTKFDLVLNLKTAKALGIKIPNSILVQATQVIE
jgi:putative ABC transport system substrate-binding protein